MVKSETQKSISANILGQIEYFLVLVTYSVYYCISLAACQEGSTSRAYTCLAVSTRVEILQVWRMFSVSPDQIEGPAERLANQTHRDRRIRELVRVVMRCAELA
jgi:hypothetical protein